MNHLKRRLDRLEDARRDRPDKPRLVLWQSGEDKDVFTSRLGIFRREDFEELRQQYDLLYIVFERNRRGDEEL